MSASVPVACPAEPAILQQFGDAVGAALRRRFVGAVVHDARMDRPDTLLGQIEGAQILLAGPARSWAGLDRPDGWPFGLRWVQLPGAGWDMYPAWLFEVPCVTSAPGLNAGAIAEYCLAAMLAHEKSHHDLWLGSAAEWRPRRLGSLEGKTVGLAGFGAIGQRVARLAGAFGMTVVAARRDLSATCPGVEFVGDVRELAEASDHLILCLPYTPETHHMVDTAFLSRCRPGLHIVNVARGGLIDLDALRAAADSGAIAGATLDVTDPEPLPYGHALYGHPLIRISSHIAWSNPHTTQRLLEYFGDQLELIFAGKPPRNIIAFPNVPSKEVQS